MFPRSAVMAVPALLLLIGTFVVSGCSQPASALEKPLTQVSQSGGKVQKTTGPLAIPFELVVKHVLLPVRVNGSRPLQFLLDTGDKFAIIDLDRARELGLSLKGEIRVGGAGSQVIPASRVQNSSFTIPGLEGFSQPIKLALPLKSFAAILGQDIDGIIGHDFIKEFVLELDYQARQIKLHDQNNFVYTGVGESVPIQIDASGHPIIEAEMTPVGGEPIKGKFLLDIGSDASFALYSPFVAEHNLLGPQLKTIRALGAVGAGGEVTGRFGRVAQLKIGKFRLANPITFFSQDKAGTFADKETQGNIGEQILSKFKVFLDYAHNRIILEPNATFSQPFNEAFSGLSLITEGKDYQTFRITDILENSPASTAGLQRDDLLLSINGRPAAELTLSEVYEIFERPVPYKLQIRRGEQTLRVTLKPARLV